jgi:hypothetical protein
MRRSGAASLLAALLLFVLSTAALGACPLPSKEVQQYLSSQPGWSVVDIKDLISDDQKLWAQHRGTSCPGIAIAKLDDSGRQAYAIALLDRAGDRLNEKVVVLLPRSARLSPRTLITAHKVDTPSVIWRAPPGDYRDWEGGPTIHVPTDSIVVEKMESNAMLYYLRGNQFHSVQTAN